MRGKERLDRDEERLPVSRLDVSEDLGVGTSGRSGRGRLGASPGALAEETNLECSFLGLVEGFNATDSASARFEIIVGRLFPRASFVMVVSVSVLFVGGASKTARVFVDVRS
jgi:hypothetical protein